jgi:UDP-N-acetylglucosamine 2-epimerase (non-hydrolysing)
MAKTVLSVVGARPQFVKAFPVSDALAAAHEEILVHTGQHYDELLSDVFFDELGIPKPQYNLGVGSGTHAVQTADVMRELDAVVEETAPDVVLVYGDTNSTLGAAIVAAKRDVDLAHVEAGLRSYNWAMPEEVNRVLTDHCADYCFAPSERAVETLASEGITDGVYETGDVTYDALLRARDEVRSLSSIVEDLGYEDGEYVLATVHRAANTDDPDKVAGIMDALADAPLPVVLPAHPRTVNALEREGRYDDTAAAIDLIDPVGYLDFVRLLVGAQRVATDSGGVQKEAFYLDTPCVTLRDRTEWAETVDAGGNVLVGADADRIDRALSTPPTAASDRAPYGDGHAARRIVDALEGST